MIYRKTRLTIKELRPVVEFFRAHFPGWRTIRNDTLVREAGPVAQGITFERLSYGAYRPVGHIRVMVAPEDAWGFELPQDLNIKMREIERRAHEQLRDKVVAAIRDEFVPNVDQPLDAQQVLEFYEQQAVPPRSPEAYSLAALNAYLGYDDRALLWCSRFTDLVNNLGNPWQDFDYERRHFLDQLEKWLRDGDARQQLDRVLQEERRKWGLV